MADDDGRGDTRRRRESPPDSVNGHANGYGNRLEKDSKPTLYKVYNGRVTGIKDFGAFVTLDGVEGRVEGK